MASRLDKSGLARLAFGLRLLCYSSENTIAGLFRRLALCIDHDLQAKRFRQQLPYSAFAGSHRSNQDDLFSQIWLPLAVL
jgi:hypothetical protein